MESGVRSTSAPQETHVCAQRTSDPALPLDLWVRILTRALAPASQTGAVTGVSAHHHAHLARNLSTQRRTLISESLKCACSSAAARTWS